MLLGISKNRVRNPPRIRQKSPMERPLVRLIRSLKFHANGKAKDGRRKKAKDGRRKKIKDW